MNLNTIGELVESYSIPTHLQEMIIPLLRCNCGNNVNFDDPYVTQEEIDEWLDIEEFIVNTFNISADDTMEFISFLQEYPMLGLSHPIGRLIFDKIKEKDIDGIEEIKLGETYFRGRTRNKLQRIVPYIEEELWNPPIGVPSQGRFNPHGVTNLYLAKNEETVLAEISPSELDIVDIAEFEVLKSIKVFNSTKTDIDIFAGMEDAESGLTSKYVYIFPNFLSQCLAYNGVNGIIYSSVKNTSFLNICLFNFNKNEDIHMTKIHQNANLKEEDPFGLKPKRKTIILEKKQVPSYKELFE